MNLDLIWLAGGAPSKKLQKRPKVRVRRSFDRKPASIESEKDCVWLADDAVWQPGRLRQHVSPACSLTNKESFNTVDLGLPEALHSMYPRRENRSSSDTVKAQEVARDDQEVHDPHRWVAPWHVCYGLPPVLPRLPSDHATRKSTSRASGTTNVLQKPKAFDGAGRQPVFSPRTASPPAVQRFYAKPFSFSSPGPVPDLELNSLPRHESNLHEHKHVHAIALLALAHHDHVVLDEDSQGLLSDTFPKAEAVPDKKGLPQAAESPEARTRPSRWLGLRPRTLRKVKRDAAMRRSYASGGSVSSRLEID